ncbi:MAG TPA: carboxymuconolactone decarboxylase family protein [Halalkalibaculum sp.]|nr:carboxymuconolactone decarboxylase family protein [Halalkalibaculum sp.]
MAQLPYIEPEEADEVTKQVYDKAEARFEMVLNIFKITGNAPEIGEKMWEIFFEILKDGQVDWVTKELLILKSTKMGDCLYCVTQHEAVSSRLGVSKEKQQDIVGVEYRNSPHYTEQEVAILDLCSHVVLNPEEIPADVWERVKKHYDDGQVIEILATIGAYLQVSKFGDAMGVELEDAFHGHQPVLFEVDPPKSKAAQKHLEHFKAQSS